MVKKMIGLFIMAFVTQTVLANSVHNGSLIPDKDGDTYYQLGGGDVTPLPYANDSIDMDLNFGGTTGMGFNCGAFSPQASLMNSLNGVRDTFGDMSNKVYQSMTGMIIGEGGYLLAKAMPNVYKFIRDKMDFGQRDMSLATKSCETMLNEVDRGQNPGNDWLQASMGDDWKYRMSLAGSGSGSDKTDDIVTTSSQISKDSGKNGVVWTKGSSHQGVKYAGGEDQPIIHLTRDTVIAGYNVLVGHNRSLDDLSPPQKSDATKRLVAAFPDPKEAADWVARVVGEQNMTTYIGGTKQSVPGLGLLPEINRQTQQINQTLTDFVEGKEPTTVENLKSISAPGIMLNVEVVDLLKLQTSAVTQAIYMNRIAEGVATARVIDKAKLALELLEVGRQVPAIYSNHAAQKGIMEEETRLRQWIKNLRTDPNDNAEFVGKTISTLLYKTNREEGLIRQTETSEPSNIMQDGAIKTDQEKK